MIYGSDDTEAKVTTNYFHLRSETFSPSHSCVVSKVHNITLYIEFIDFPIIYKHCGSVDTKYGLWIKCKLCEKVIMCRTGRPFNVVRWREYKSEITNYLTKINLEKEKQRM